MKKCNSNKNKFKPVKKKKKNLLCKSAANWCSDPVSVTRTKIRWCLQVWTHLNTASLVKWKTEILKDPWKSQTPIASSPFSDCSSESQCSLSILSFCRSRKPLEEENLLHLKTPQKKLFHKRWAEYIWIPFFSSRSSRRHMKPTRRTGDLAEGAGVCVWGGLLKPLRFSIRRENWKDGVWHHP